MPCAWRDALAWARATAIDGWRGVRCSGRGAVVRAIRLDEGAPRARAAAAAVTPRARLQSLEALDLSQNHLTGHVPAGLGEARHAAPAVPQLEPPDRAVPTPPPRLTRRWRERARPVRRPRRRGAPAAAHAEAHPAAARAVAQPNDTQCEVRSEAPK